LSIGTAPDVATVPESCYPRNGGWVFIKIKIGRFLRKIVGVAVPPLRGPLEAGAAALREAKKRGKSVDQQLPIAVQAAVEETDAMKRQRLFVYGAGGLAVLVLVFMAIRGRR